MRHFFVLLASLALLPAFAILIRPDRDDAEYVEMATRYTSSVSLKAPGGEGVLIAPRWVLTAAHMAKTLQEMKTPPALRFAERDYEIQSLFIHPDWKKGGPSDIALVLLRKDVRGVAPTPIYRESDEGGKAVVIVGHGETGKIGARPSASDGRKRAAINTIDRVEPRLIGLKIKPAEEASDLQGATAPGDGGGPAIVETGDGMFVVGVRSVGASDWEIYARVSTFAPWIDAVMLDVATDEARELLDGKGS